MLEIVPEKSKLPPGFTNLDNLPDNCLFLVYLRVLKDTLKLPQLVKKLTCWFRDCRKNAFSYRFTGKETKVFCHKFMFIIQCLNHAADCSGPKTCSISFFFVYSCEMRFRISLRLKLLSMTSNNANRLVSFFII
jgi:hypothetical protein